MVSGTSGGGASFSAEPTIRFLPSRRNARPLASSTYRRASSQVTSNSRSVIVPCTEESVTRLNPHNFERALSTSAMDTPRNSSSLMSPGPAGAPGTIGCCAVLISPVPAGAETAGTIAPAGLGIGVLTAAVTSAVPGGCSGTLTARMFGAERCTSTCTARTRSTTTRAIGGLSWN